MNVFKLGWIRDKRLNGMIISELFDRKNEKNEI